MSHMDDRMAHAFTVDVEDWYHGGPDDMPLMDGMSRLANGHQDSQRWLFKFKC